MFNADHRQRLREYKPLDFFRGFLKEPRQVGSVIPSSRFMERKIIEFADLGADSVVVELGPGTGGTTRALLQALGCNARVIAIDLDPAFVRIVSGIHDARLGVEQGSAAELGLLLGRHGLKQADVVVSGIPFSTMPESVGTEILRAVHDRLAPRGRLVAYQFRAEVARLAGPIFGPPSRESLVALNIPPMRIWRWDR